MAINIGSNFNFNGEDYLDSRIKVESISDLKNWNFNKVHIPDGFEVYCEENKEWYVYDISQKENPETGFFSKRIPVPFGVPVYTDNMISDLNSSGLLPEEYVQIRSTSPKGSVVNNTYQTSQSGSYVDVLFSCIRALQTEVAKLRNSFKYGIYSYTGTNTAKSYISEELGTAESEPLWSLDEEGLSFLYEPVYTELYPVSGSDEVIVYSTSARINGESYWSDTPDKIITSCDDPKLIVFLETTSLNIKIKLSNNTIFDLSGLYKQDKEKYNIQIIFSKQTYEESDSLHEKPKGYNYVWVSVTDNYNLKLCSGYLFNTEGTTNISPIEKLLDSDYSIEQLIFKNLDLTKFIFYSKYQEFTHEVIPSIPEEDEYKFRAAHITIRSVSSKLVLDSISDELPENELIWSEKDKKLYIKSKGSVLAVGSGTSGSGSGSYDEDDTMTTEELIIELKKLGIVYTDSDNNLQLNDISEINLVNEDTGKKFNYRVNASGELESREISDKTIKEAITHKSEIALSDLSEYSVRGFIGQLGLVGYNETNKNAITIAKDHRLYSDRLKIGSLYAPLSEDKVNGCTHAFIELENTSCTDIPLKGCYIHFTYPEKVEEETVTRKTVSLELTGTIKAGSTYLIRGKKYTNKFNSGSYIKVDTYDQEWYINGELLDLTINYPDLAYGFALTYGNKVDGRIIDHNSLLSITRDSFNTRYPDLNSTYTKLGITDTKATVTYHECFIDSLVIGGFTTKDAVNLYNDQGTVSWATYAFKVNSNCIIKNKFELDPAKQAFQSCTTYDSSRIRWQTTADIEYLNLDKEFIEFPHSFEKTKVSKFTPKSSKENKTVYTDKTDFDTEKPNMVTCSFGINPYRTRTFNWISGGLFDEYVWIRKKGDETWERHESYKMKSDTEVALDVTTTGGTFTRKDYTNSDTVKIIYSRMTNTFPGTDIIYTSHKCILSKGNSESSPTEYEYVVGRSDKNGNPDESHSSDIMSFTLCPESYLPKIYQVTDQQGFTWVEYQAWAATAAHINSKINSDKSNVIPVLINTGDMTQNGTRYNEWIDYYIAGKSLFTHLEQVNVVGNNDLCDIDINILGTGDDTGKSNSHFFHIFYCYEVDESNLPICNGKYIPSLYYIDFNNLRLVLVNSELTETACKSWFNLQTPDKEDVINIYTGFNIKTIPQTYYPEVSGYNNFTPVYNILYKIFKSAKDDNKKIITACHEMPFTVITKKCLSISEIYRSRSLSEAGALIGSHLNQISKNESSSGKGLYWFSRLLEDMGVKLCLGGHKHTYSLTYPLRENYIWEENGSYYGSATSYISETGSNESTSNIVINGETKTVNYVNHGMTMGETLKDDSAIWLDPNYHFKFSDNSIYSSSGEPGTIPNLSKFPLVYTNDKFTNPASGEFYPSKINYNDNSTSSYVTYFMCQASGFKLKSNKELPANEQVFSEVIPKSTHAGTGDKPSKEQQYPMFGMVELNEDYLQAQLKEIRLANILNSDKSLTQISPGTGDLIKEQYLNIGEIDEKGSKDRFGKWIDTESVLKTITL